MTVTVRIKGLNDFAYSTEIAAPISVLKLKQRFCRELSLAPESCTLSVDRDALLPSAPSEGQQEVIGPNSAVTAIAEMSLAFHNWSRVSRSCFTSSNSETFSMALQCITPFHCWGALGFTAEESLASFAHLSPLESIPADTSEGVHHAAASYKRFLAVLLGSLAARGTETLYKYKALLMSNPVHSLGSYPTEAKPSQGIIQMGQLRRVLLLLKLASLLACIKYATPEMREGQCMVAIVLGKLVSDLPEHVMDSYSGTPVETKLMLTTVALLAEMTVPLIRQRATANPAVWHAGDACLQLLAKLMTNNRGSQEIGPMLIKQGIWPPLVAALELRGTRSTAVSALKVMVYLLQRYLDETQAGEAEALLCRMQAHHRLCNFLCPPFHLAGKDYYDIQGPEVFDKAWLPEQADLATVSMASGLAKNMLKHEPPPTTDPGPGLPTPSPAQWAAIKAAASKALVAVHWHRHHPEEIKRMPDGFGMVGSLRDIPQRLLLGHLLNPELDVQNLLRLCTYAILYDWDPFGKSNQVLPLALAVVKRLGQDPKHLTLDLRHQQSMHHRGWGCQGCRDCCRNDWQWRTELVATIFPHLAHDACHGDGKEAAAAIANALYAALDCPEHCQHLLLGTQGVPGKNLAKDNQVSINLAITEFDRGVGQQLTAQMNTIACLARLCEQEVEHAPDWSLRGSSDPTPWYTTAKKEGTFEYAIGSFMHAFKTSAPWSTQRCVALTRALYQCFQLQESFPPDQPRMYTQQEPQLLRHFMLALAHFEDVTHGIPASLRLHLLTACMQFLQRAMAAPGAVSKKKSLQDLPLLMIKAVHLIGPNSQHEEAGQPCAYPSFGLPLADGQLWKLRSAWLQNVMYIIMDSDKYHMGFGQHAYPTVKTWFLQLVWGPSGAPLPGARGPFEEEKLSQSLLDPMPYLVMFRLQGQVYEATKLASSQPDTLSARAMMLCLFHVLTRLVRLHKTIRSAQLTAVSARRTGSVPQEVAVAADWAEGKIGLAREMLDRMLWAVESLRDDGPWGLFLPGVIASWGWVTSPQQKEAMSAHLAHDKLILHNQLSRIEALFPSQSSVEENSSKQRQQTAIEELLAEEARETAKAAAKKAKKQKQKAKKQQQQQQLDEEAEERRQLLEQQQEQLQQQLELERQQLLPQATGQPSQGSAYAATTDPEFADVGLAEASAPADRTRDADAAVSTSAGVASSADKTSDADAAVSMPAGVASAAGLSTEQEEEAGLEAEASCSSQDFLQGLFCCPLTKGLMLDPVIAADGHSYERTALQDWLARHDTSPVTGQTLQHKRIVDNVLIRNAIGRHREQQKSPAPSPLSSPQQRLRQCF